MEPLPWSVPFSETGRRGNGALVPGTCADPRESTNEISAPKEGVTGPEPNFEPSSKTSGTVHQ